MFTSSWCLSPCLNVELPSPCMLVGNIDGRVKIAHYPTLVYVANRSGSPSSVRLLSRDETGRSPHEGCALSAEESMEANG